MRDPDLLSEIKERAEGYAQELRAALALLQAPDISGELIDISQKLNGFKIKLANTLDSLHYPEMGNTIQRLASEAELNQREIQKAVTNLGYPNLIDDYEKAKFQRDAYRAAAWDMIKDLQYVSNVHASDYANRRIGEMQKRLGDIEK